MGTTPIYGFPYPDPSDLVANYPALGQQLAEDVEDQIVLAGGLVPVVPTSIATTGGSGSVTGNATSFTAVTAISINGVFTSTFTNYRIVVSGATSTTGTGGEVFLRLRAAGTDAATNYSQNGVAAGTSLTVINQSSQTSAFLGFTGFNSTNSRWGSMTMDVIGPQDGDWTPLLAQSIGVNAANAEAYVTTGNMHRTAASYDGFSILYPFGMSGIIRVYGYRN